MSRRCRECGIEHIEPGTEVDGEPLCWADDDLCSRCQDWLQKSLEEDAARYRHIRNRQARAIDIGLGGLFVGRVPENVILTGGHLDQAIDDEMGAMRPAKRPLEERLAKCLAELVDTPILSGKDECGGYSSPLDIRLGFFNPELANRAAELLEEAGV